MDMENVKKRVSILGSQNEDVIPVMFRSDVIALVDALKEYVKSKKQIVQFSSKKNFPVTGKKNLYYVDTSNFTVYTWDTEGKTYKVLNMENAVLDTDNILLNSGGAFDSFNF